jgi:mRNA interferase MazF
MQYVPERGEVAWINLDPQAGHEQAGHRPVLILSPAGYNGKTGMMLCCPLTTKIKGYPFEVVIKDNLLVSGAILADQVKCLDWRTRGVKKKGIVSAKELEEVLNKLKALLLISA